MYVKNTKLAIELVLKDPSDGWVKWALWINCIGIVSYRLYTPNRMLHPAQ